MDEAVIRPATEADLQAISDIYNHYVLHDTCTFQIEPETIESRRDWFAAHGERHPVIVAEGRSGVIGWGSLSKFRERAAYDRTVEPSVYLDHRHLGRGLGRVLLVELIDHARRLGYHTVIGGTCSEKTASIKLQAALGFQPVARLREVGFKFGRWLDVEYMQLML